MEKDSEKMVDQLIELGADINAKDEDGKTALFYAVEKGNEEIVEKLIDRGADINAKDKDGKTALFYANNEECDTALVLLSSRDVTCPMARMLIDGGAQVDARDRYGRTALFYAMTQSLPLAEYLFDKGASLHLDEDCSVLTFLIEKCFYSLPGENSKLRYGLNLLAKRVEVREKTILEAIASVAFCKILHFKPRSGDIDVDSIRALMMLAKEKSSSFETEIRVNEISRLLHKGCHDKQLIESGAAVELLQLLIRLGANPNTTDSDGNTALHHATQLAFNGVSQESVMKICQQLLKLNISCHKINHQNQTPLLHCLTRTIEKVPREQELWPASKTQAAVKVSREEKPLVSVKTQAAVCQFLVKNGASVKLKTGSGETVLHLTIKQLLQQGFYKDTSELRKDISDAALKLLKEFVVAFKREEVSINIEDNSGNTPLHLWAKLQLAPGQDYSTNITEEHNFHELLKEILDYLIDNEGLLDAKNENGETPLHLCRTWTAVELLLDAGANPNVKDSSGRLLLLAATANIKPLQNPGRVYPDVLQQPKAFWETAVLEKGLDPWTFDKQGESVMSKLIEAEAFDLAKGLIEFACEDNNLDSAIIFSLLLTVCKDKSTHAREKINLVQIILESGKCSTSGKEGQDSPLHLCCKNIVRNPEGADVHREVAKNLLLYEADCKVPDSSGQSCLDIAEGCPKLKDFLLKPIDIEKLPKFITKWRSCSTIHKDKLARVSSGIRSKHVKQYWYHQQCLARGSFGAVFAGINEKDGREVSIKRIEKIRMTRPEDEREITHLTALADCEQVVRYFSFFEDEDFCYIVLELMEGNLDHFLNNAIQMDTNKVSLCQDIVNGVKFLHDHNIIHRDLKPSNILYKAHPKLCFKLADFGLSRWMDSTGSSISVYGSNVGTRCWIAPEVLKSTGKAHSKSSDVFASGLVLHYILSEKLHPFAHRKDAPQHETEANISNGKMVGWDDSLCPEAAHLLKAMLDGDKSKRPSADKALDHPFFWSKEKKLDLLNAVGNQKEFGFPRAKRTLPLTAVETDLEKSFSTIVKFADWNAPCYVHMPAVYAEMTTRRRYNTNSVVELVRFIRNAYAHVTALPEAIKDQLLEDFVFFEYFPNLVMEVYKAVTTHGWDTSREEIKHALR